MREFRASLTAFFEGKGPLADLRQVFDLRLVCSRTRSRARQSTWPSSLGWAAGSLTSLPIWTVGVGTALVQAACGSGHVVYALELHLSRVRISPGAWLCQSFTSHASLGPYLASRSQGPDATPPVRGLRLTDQVCDWGRDRPSPARAR